MELVINHLTRMREGRICVAGIDITSGKHVRPQPYGTRWERSSLRDASGPFEIGARCAITYARPHPVPPHCEDVTVNAQGIERVGRLRDHAFWALLLRVAGPHCHAIFGEVIERTGTGATCMPRIGSASLGCLTPRPFELEVRGASMYAHVDDAHLGRLRLHVTDVRMHHPDGTVRHELVRIVGRRIESGGTAVLAVGLARAYGDPPRHWLQLNNIHFPDSFNDHPSLRRPRTA